MFIVNYKGIKMKKKVLVAVLAVAGVFTAAKSMAQVTELRPINNYSEYVVNVATCMAHQGPADESWRHFEDIVDYNVMMKPEAERDDYHAKMVNEMSDVIGLINDERMHRLNSLLDIALLVGHKSEVYEQAFGNFTTYNEAVRTYCVIAEYNDPRPQYYTEK